MAFDAGTARDVVLPLAQAAYTVLDGGIPVLPPGYTATGLITADPAHLAALPDNPPAAAMVKDTNVFGLLGRNAAEQTAFLAFRGSSDVADWLADFDVIPADYRPVAGFGQVHAGFQDVYECTRASIAAQLPAAAAAGCEKILITGHSLGAALAVLAAPDIARAMPGNTIEPRVITFGGPRVGLADFAAAFDAAIECCYRVVNFLDIVPLVPPAPYTHVGAGIAVDSGGKIDLSWRHSLPAYSAGLSALIAKRA